MEYKKKQRPLKIRMLDGTVKTVMVDDSKNVTDMLMTICARIGERRGAATGGRAGGGERWQHLMGVLGCGSSSAVSGLAVGMSEGCVTLGREHCSAPLHRSVLCIWQQCCAELGPLLPGRHYQL